MYATNSDGKLHRPVRVTREERLATRSRNFLFVVPVHDMSLHTEMARFTKPLLC